MSEIVVVGSLNVDSTIPVPRVPVSGETILGSELSRSPGGKGANQAVACARLGRGIAMVGALGDDAEGDSLLDLLLHEGVDITAVGRSSHPTGQAVILVEPDGESTIVVSPGANASLSVKDLDDASDLITSARCVLVQQEISVEAVARAAELSSGLFVLNPAPARDVALDVLERTDVLVPNRFELAVLCGAAPSEDLDTLAHMARDLTGPDVIVITLGAAGALVIAGGRSTHVPAQEVTSVDSTAAGDTFCAALTDALLDDADVVEAARWAVRAAAVTVTRPGAMRSIPTRTEIML